MKWLESLLSARQNATARDAEGETRKANEPRGRDPVAAKGMFVCAGVYGETDGLYLVDEDGKVAARLAESSETEMIGRFAVSPDARWVAYTCHVRRHEGRDSYPLIRVVPAAGGASTDLTPWEEHYETCYQNPVFSPQGDRLVCESALRHPYNPDLEVLELFAAGNFLAASGSRRIVNPHRIGNHSPVFTPDGGRIVYFGNFAYEDMLEVCLYDPADAQGELLGEVGWRITENADGVWRRPRAIAFQAQWEQIFFIQGHTRDRERICLLLLPDLPPGAHAKHFDSVGGEYDRVGALEMSRDGLRLAFDADHAVYVIGADGSGLRRVSADGMSCHCPRLSEDGERVAFVADGKLCVAACDGAATETRAIDGLRVDEFVWT